MFQVPNKDFSRLVLWGYLEFGNLDFVILSFFFCHERFVQFESIVKGPDGQFGIF